MPKLEKKNIHDDQKGTFPSSFVF